MAKPPQEKWHFFNAPVNRFLKNIQQFNERGWIPGPGEEEKIFEKRIEALDHFFSYPPEDIDHFLTDQDWTPAQETLKHLYDFSPDWIVAHYSNQKLSFFQGAATWITENNDLRIPLIQLREKFESGKLFGLYQRKEVLAHEATHAARMQFDEPLFEEIFAYKTSPRFWRRFLGPLFQHTWEAYTFIFLLLFPIAIEIALLFDFELGPLIFLRFAPLVFFGYLLVRLIVLRATLGLALLRLRKFLKNPKKNWAVAFRLKDREIFQFALQTQEKLKQYLKEQNSLRWDLVKQIYFKK
ncbi:MAG: hypothetical protein KR126chlam3_01388 [Chlamydiae bacterium]|nr:hypothetical protein [Chlamydiota bacterium]